MMVLKPGDKICGWDVIKEIVDARPTGYGWRYPHIEGEPDAIGENYFISENSGDPFFELGWSISV